ncbi:hypothetical protein UA08_05842 [Talaromyces atroroseus]|uniref:Uncharacterized protein n=1 Tax=Talaromyces atroroseus TaxID=1441469 RepID=A0A225AZX7_TALAT|nr:hypothetical protein UA08_05842 [Talaromyces atroroseus]OKL59087.1 hypothetical protein UA08_05842 [Talaromyces atroroseus]
MAGLIAVAGGIASVSQVLVYLAQTTKHVVEFYGDFTEAPIVLHRIKEKLHLLQQMIAQVQSYVIEHHDSDILPSETKELLLGSVRRVQDSLDKAKLKCHKVTDKNIKKTMKRVVWVLRDEPALSKLLQDLNDSDHILHLVMQVLIMKTTTLALQYQSTAIKEARGNRATAGSQPLVSLPKWTNRPNNSWPWWWWWLRQYGFYGTLKIRQSHSQHLLDTHILLGYKFPAWLWSKSIDIELKFQLPRCIRMQNRVPVDSPFIVACRNGDVQRIRQSLADKPGSVGDRLSCTGETPLMLTIECGNMDAMKVLLDAGADPNVGDDDGITPVFRALGMNPRRNKIFPQLPPRNPMWVDIIRLLVEYDASVHEVVNGNSLTTLNLIWHKNKSRTLEFFHFLHDQYYVDFGADKIDGFSAFTSAFRSVGSSLECIQFLYEKVGLDFSRISADGRSLLHLGAEYAHEPETIEYLCRACPSDYINRQDDLGWTPLHYAIFFEGLHKPEDSLAKVELLIRHGANPYIKSTRLPMFCTVLDIDTDRFTAFELCEALPSHRYEQFLDIVRNYGYDIPEEAETNVFYEAVA